MSSIYHCTHEGGTVDLVEDFRGWVQEQWTLACNHEKHFSCPCCGRPVVTA